jgi:hypothetical protein
LNNNTPTNVPLKAGFAGTGVGDGVGVGSGVAVGLGERVGLGVELSFSPSHPKKPVAQKINKRTI